VQTPAAESPGDAFIGGQQALALLRALDSAAAFNPSALAAAVAPQSLGQQTRVRDCFSARHERLRAPEPCMEEDDELSDEEKKKLEELRSKLMGQFRKDAGPAPAMVPAKAEPPAKPEAPLVQRAGELARGRVLVANPEKFFSNNILSEPVRDLNRFKLRGPLDERYSPDQYANFLPCILLVDYEKGKPSRGVLMERRTGALMGDLGSDYGCVAISPLWEGGQEMRNSLTIVHNVDDMPSADKLGDEGLYTGGWKEAAPRLSNSSLAEGRFKFYLGSTVWRPGQLDEEVGNGAWFVLKVDPEIFLKDRILGWQPGRRKPIWRDLMKEVKGDEEVSQVFSKVYPEAL